MAVWAQVITRYSLAFAIVGAVAVFPAWAHEDGEPDGDHHGGPILLEKLPTQAAQPGQPVPELQLPVLSGDNKPWTSSTLNNDPNNFQFAIVSDRTGGARPGIFEKAMDKLNILQPEFVMSVGDLIQGYTRNEDALDDQWDELESLIARLQMPFFYVPGNHDMSTPVARQTWHERFGVNYYHFVYGNVLFLCLDSEDGDPAGLSNDQVNYFRKVLDDHKDVRWTLAFLHRPLWNYGEASPAASAGKTDRPEDPVGNWSEFEDLLKSRKHTVYAGHVHSYTKYVRHNSNYITLATTGGGSAMRGVHGYGQFDHVTWITLTDEGPIMANIELDGIHDENLRTEEIAKLASGLLGSGVHAEVAVTDPLPFTSTTLDLKLRNPGNIPVVLELYPIESGVSFQPSSATLTLAPRERRDFSFAVDGSRLQGEHELVEAVLKWRAVYHPKDKPPLDIAGNAPLKFDITRKSTPATAATAIDGQFEEWSDLWTSPQRFQVIIGKAKTWSGPSDATLQLASRYDDNFVYVAARVNDDSVVSSDDKFKGADRVELYLASSSAADPASTVTKANVVVKAAPSDKISSGVVTSEPEVSAYCVPTEGGYQVELAVPTSLLTGSGDKPWDSFRLNARVVDRDTTGSKSGVFWWRPEWNTEQSYEDSGLFVR